MNLVFLYGRLAAGTPTVGLELAIESRLASTQRPDFKKLTDPAFDRYLRSAGTFRTPWIPRTDLRIDSENHRPAASAHAIAVRFGLLRS